MKIFLRLTFWAGFIGWVQLLCHANRETAQRPLFTPKFRKKKFEMFQTESLFGITLRSLRVFVALEEQKTISAAAAVLGLSKSNVSQNITALEESLGTLLFDRKQRPISLTPSGQVLSFHAHRIFTAVSEAETALAEFSVENLPVLNFAIIDDLDASLTPVVATALQDQLSRSFISTYSGRSDAVTARLISREADLAVTANLPGQVHKFQIQQLYTEQFILVTANGAYDPALEWSAQLSKLPFVQYSEAMPMGQLVSAHLKRIGFNGERRFSFETTRSVIATVARAKGWTMATPLSVLDASRFLDEIDLHLLPFPALSRSIFLVNRSNELGALPQFFADTIRRLLKTELFPEFVQSADHLAGAFDIAYPEQG